MQLVVQLIKLGGRTSGFYLIHEGLYPLEMLLCNKGGNHPDRQTLKNTHQVVEMLNIPLREFGYAGADVRNDRDKSILFELFQGFSNLTSRNTKDFGEMDLDESFSGFQRAACDSGFKILYDLLPLFGVI